MTNAWESRTYTVGETIDLGDISVTLNSSRISMGTKNHEDSLLADGEMWLILDCTVENKSTIKIIDVDHTLRFSLVDQDYYERKRYHFFDLKLKGNEFTGDLGPMRKMRSEIAFVVDVGQRRWEFIVQIQEERYQGIFIITEDEKT